MTQTTADSQESAERAPGSVRRGRPPSVDVRAFESAALDLFAAHGFEATTVDMIAAAAGSSRRTFFRYFDSKSGVLWLDFDAEVTKLRETLFATGSELSVMDAVRQSVVAVNRYGAQDVPELRLRMIMISSTPELAASAAIHYDAWERAVSDFVADRHGLDSDSLFPLAVGRATLAVCRAAYDRWIARADADLTVYLDAGLRALAAGFDATTVSIEPPTVRRRP